MSPMPSPGQRRSLWAFGAVAVLTGLLVWLLVSGSEEPDNHATGTPDETIAAAPTPTPGSEPSSGPTETPSPGSLDVVPMEEVTPEPAIPLTATADFGTGLTLEIVRIESVKGVAKGVGEVAGPALRLTLRMANASDTPVSLEGAVVEVASGADRAPASTLSGPGVRPFGGEVPAHGSVTAAYVFGVPEEARDRLQVTVSYTAAAPVVVFAGAAR